MTSARLQDAHGRVVDYVRVSLTAACNFRCAFCMPAEGAEGGAAENLSRDERRRLCRILAGCGVRHFKITGGEPFMAEGAVELMAWLKHDLGAESVTVTTNGSTLDRHAEGLAAAGVDGVNVGVNAVSPQVFRTITRAESTPRRILGNILLAKSLGLAVKMNMVPLCGVNDGDILPLAEFAGEHGIPLRFIELMPVGPAAFFRSVPLNAVRRLLEERFGPISVHDGRFGNGPAAYFRAGVVETPFGYIAALSRRFCADCNRVRLTGSGFLRTCLHHEDGVNLSAALRAGEDDTAIARRVAAAVAAKPGGHLLDAAAGRVTDAGFMFRIGG